jgi:hypothetical protein
MAATHNVKLDKGTTVKALFEGDPKALFTIKGTDASGELVDNADGSTKIAYKVSGDTVTFTMTKAPRLYKEPDQKLMLKNLFG